MTCPLTLRTLFPLSMMNGVGGEWVSRFDSFLRGDFDKNRGGVDEIFDDAIH